MVVNSNEDNLMKIMMLVKTYNGDKTYIMDTDTPL